MQSYLIGRLAQLVQSTSFTPRGSGVRTPHRPQKFILSMNFFQLKGSLTQLVQSVTSTTWKSLVRIQYDPHQAQSQYILHWDFCFLIPCFFKKKWISYYYLYFDGIIQPFVYFFKKIVSLFIKK